MFIWLECDSGAGNQSWMLEASVRLYTSWLRVEARHNRKEEWRVLGLGQTLLLRGVIHRDCRSVGCQSWWHVPVWNQELQTNQDRCLSYSAGSQTLQYLAVANDVDKNPVCMVHATSSKCICLRNQWLSSTSDLDFSRRGSLRTPEEAIFSRSDKE